MEMLLSPLLVLVKFIGLILLCLFGICLVIGFLLFIAVIVRIMVEYGKNDKNT